jgi:phage baseplate assembly protein W
MNSEFGSGLWNILFENYGDDIKPIIESTIRKDISRWMGYVNIKSVSIKPSEDTNIGRYTVGVSIVFTVPTAGINNPQTVDIEMNTNPL